MCRSGKVYIIETELNIMSIYAHVQGAHLPLLIIGVVSGAPPSYKPTTTSIGGGALKSSNVIGSYIVC